MRALLLLLILSSKVFPSGVDVGNGTSSISTFEIGMFESEFELQENSKRLIFNIQQRDIFKVEEIRRKGNCSDKITTNRIEVDQGVSIESDVYFGKKIYQGNLHIQFNNCLNPEFIPQKID